MSIPKAYSHSLSRSDEGATGTGICDGFIPTEEEFGGEECGCSCHAAWESPGETVSEVALWHAEQRRLYGPAVSEDVPSR